MMMALGARRSRKQRLALRRQDAWRRDQQRRKRPLRGGRKCFSYRAVCTSSAISTSSSRFHLFSFDHFHSFSYFEFFKCSLPDTTQINQCVVRTEKQWKLMLTGSNVCAQLLCAWPLYFAPTCLNNNFRNVLKGLKTGAQAFAFIWSRACVLPIHMGAPPGTTSS